MEVMWSGSTRAPTFRMGCQLWFTLKEPSGQRTCSFAAKPLKESMPIIFLSDGAGPGFIKNNLEKITEIEYRPLQCVISDHSKNDEIENIVKSIEPKGVDVVYVRYPENYENLAHNWNNALKLH